MINSVGPAAATAAPSAPTPPGGVLGKDEFLKMLVAQLQNQDPMSPMQADQMAAQLAQFSSVEQLISMNEAMAGQQAAMEAMSAGLNSNAALGAIGRTVTALGNQVVVPADGQGSVSATVGGSGGTATLRLYDAAGNEVGSRSLGRVGPGTGRWELGGAAQGLEPGAYSYAIEVVDGEGAAVPVQSYTTGRVDGIQYGSNGPVLRAGPLTIPFGSIVEIHAAE